MNPINIDRSNKFVLGYIHYSVRRYKDEPAILNSYGIPGNPVWTRGYYAVCGHSYSTTKPIGMGGPGHWMVKMGLFQDE
jgi:hypothetical protein